MRSTHDRRRHACPRATPPVPIGRPTRTHSPELRDQQAARPTEVCGRGTTAGPVAPHTDRFGGWCVVPGRTRSLAIAHDTSTSRRRECGETTSSPTAPWAAGVAFEPPITSDPALTTPEARRSAAAFSPRGDRQWEPAIHKVCREPSMPIEARDGRRLDVDAGRREYTQNHSPCACHTPEMLGLPRRSATSSRLHLPDPRAARASDPSEGVRGTRSTNMREKSREAAREEQEGRLAIVLPDEEAAPLNGEGRSRETT